MKTLVLIFAKYPTPGSVKTRFVPPLSSREAAELHSHALAAVCELVDSIAACEMVLVVSPDDQVEVFRALLPTCPKQVWPQGSGDLGARMSRAVDHAFTGGASSVILLGADSPTLPSYILEKAISLLCDYEIVLGPSSDGGYYLIGMNKPHSELFGSVDWGTDAVLEQTRVLTEQIEADVAELPEWYDLDRFDDLVGAAADLVKIGDEEMALRPALLSLRTFIDQLIKRAAKHE